MNYKEVPQWNLWGCKGMHWIVVWIIRLFYIRYPTVFICSLGRITNVLEKVKTSTGTGIC